MSKKDEALAEQPARQQEPVATCTRCGDGLVNSKLDGALCGDCASIPMRQQEPVAIGRVRLDSGKVHIHPFVREADIAGLIDGQRVFTSPPASKPLTDEQIYSVLENLQVMYNRPPTTDSRIIFARAIEAAHGIKENKK